MLGFLKNNKRNQDGKQDPYEKFLNNMRRYLEYYKIPFSEEEKEKLSKSYEKAVETFVAIIKEKYPEAILGGKLEEFDPNDYPFFDLSSLNTEPNFETHMYNEPGFGSLVYINTDQSSAHFHVDGLIITEAEMLECLPGLDRRIATPKFNNIFKGLNVEYAHVLLQQMRILPIGKEFDQKIQDLKERRELHHDFLTSIIYLLINEGEFGIKRAMIFAKQHQISFPFEFYFPKHEDELQLKLDKKDI